MHSVVAIEGRQGVSAGAFSIQTTLQRYEYYPNRPNAGVTFNISASIHDKYLSTIDKIDSDGLPAVDPLFDDGECRIV